MARANENNNEALQRVAEESQRINDALIDMELHPSQNYGQDELNEMRDCIISSRRWFQDLQARKKRLEMLLKAQEKAYFEIQKRKQREIDELTRVAAAGEACMKLMTGEHKPEEKDELREKVKGVNTFEDTYKNYIRVSKQHEILERVAQFQRDKIEELQAENSKKKEELREVRERNSWKRIFLSLYCARTEED